MPTTLSTTGFSRLTPARARGVLAAFIAATLFFIGITLSPLASGFADAPDRGPNDISLYRAEVGRIQAGETYYDAVAAELTTRGYPTRSVFNWRTPLPIWLLGHLPDPVLGRIVLGILAAGVIALAFFAVAREEQLGRALFCSVLLIGALMPCVLGEFYVMHELWAGALIGLSVLAYGMNRPAWGMAAGFAALVIRELALPYCVLCFAMAVWQGRRRETIAWIIAAAVYVGFYALHAAAVIPRIRPDAIAHAGGWICFGGAGFVISTVQMSAWLLIVPQWVTAIYLALALIGFAGWTAPWGRRAALAAALYLAGLAIVGQPFNQYWGSLVAPLLCLGVAQAPAAIRDLWRCAKSTRAVASFERGASPAANG